MSWIDFTWPMLTGACVTLGLIHLRIGLRRTPGAGHLLFALNALVVAVYSCLELALMRADSPARYLAVMRWMDIVGGGVLVASLTAFVWVYFGTGRRWLAILPSIVMGVALIPDLLPVPKVVFLQLTKVTTHQALGGASFPVADGVRNPWNLVFYLGVLLLLVFVLDASLTLWRRGARRREAIVGGAIVFFVLVAGIHSGLVDAGVVRMPYLFSAAYVAILVAMGIELSHDAAHAERLAGDLHESEQRMTLAAQAAGIGIWVRDLRSKAIWASDKWRELLGFAPRERLDFERILQRMHPDDRQVVQHAMESAVANKSGYETEYRLMLPDGGTRWISSHGAVESDAAGQPIFIRGASRDVTARRQAEQQASLLQQEIAHVGRVTMMGQLAASLAHEINQPLGAILRNVEAAELMMRNSSPDLDELRAILADIHQDDQRAGAVIDRMRTLLKRRDLDMRPLDVGELIAEAARVARGDAAERHVRLDVDVPGGLPRVRGDCVHLQQVLLNLILNGLDACDGIQGRDRRVTVAARADGPRAVEIAVRDTGHGIPVDSLSHIFNPFFTTKANGMGMGLAISRTIIEAHGGRIWVENEDGVGATFRFTLRTVDEADTQ